MSAGGRRHDDWLHDLLTAQLARMGGSVGQRTESSSDERVEVALDAGACPSVTEPRADDVAALILRALADDLVWSLAAETHPVEPGLAWPQQPIGCGSVQRVVPTHPAHRDGVGVSVNSLVADDGSVDRALWSLVRDNWRRGTPLFGDTVH